MELSSFSQHGRVVLLRKFLCLTLGLGVYKSLQVDAAYGYQDTCRTVQGISSMSIATSKKKKKDPFLSKKKDLLPGSVLGII